MSRRYTVVGSFKFAISGLREAIINEPNFQVHSVAAITAIVAAGILNFNHTEWIILAFTIAFVLILELVNTAIENIVDLISPEIQPEAKVAKDVAASAVFIAAVLALVVGFFLFAPKVSRLVQLSNTATATPTIMQ